MLIYIEVQKILLELHAERLKEIEDLIDRELIKLWNGFKAEISLPQDCNEFMFDYLETQYREKGGWEVGVVCGKYPVIVFTKPR